MMVKEFFIFLGATRRLFPSTTERELECMCSIDLKHARDRQGGRQRRSLKTINEDMTPKQKKICDDEHFTD